jgi:hypothetical protein
MLALISPAIPQARGADVSVDFFYNNLAGGNWIEVEGYGYGWQPDVAVSDPNWRPYADGYWAYTDFGWTWVSYEDFGWATYHYGRWANLADYGWMWIPGSGLDWGPAWVSWRTGGDYVGWAPLPPRGPGIVYEGQPIGGQVDIEFDIGPQYYNFCDVRFIGEPVLRDRIFPPAQNITYIDNTVNVTNITVQNNVVYNYGPDYNVLNAYSTRPIQRLSVERQPATNLTVAAKSGALTRVQGDKLVVAAPQKITKPAQGMAPPQVKTKIAQPKVEHGWAGVANAEQVKQKIKTENPKNIPPPTRPAAAGRAAVGGVSPGASPGATAGPAATAPLAPGRKGRPGRVPPGATGTPAGPAGASPSPGITASPFERGRGRGRPGALGTPAGSPPSGISPAPGATASPFERGRGRGRPGAQPGVTGTPVESPAGASPSPFERGKGRGRPGAQPGVTGTPVESPAGASPSPFERGKGRGRPGAQPGFTPPEPPAGAASPTIERSPRAGEQERGKPGRGRFEASPPPQGGPPGQTGVAPVAPEATQLPGKHRGEFERGRPTPATNQPDQGMARSPGPPTGAPGEARGPQRERGVYTQPGGPPQGASPAETGRPGKPERGKKKGEESPPPGPPR